MGGPYAGEPAEVDHIIPIAVAPELGREIANLEILPRTLNRRKGATMGARQRDLAGKFLAAVCLRGRNTSGLPSGAGSRERSTTTPLTIFAAPTDAKNVVAKSNLNRDRSQDRTSLDGDDVGGCVCTPVCTLPFFGARIVRKP